MAASTMFFALALLLAIAQASVTDTLATVDRSDPKPDVQCPCKCIKHAAAVTKLCRRVPYFFGCAVSDCKTKRFSGKQCCFKNVTTKPPTTTTAKTTRPTKPTKCPCVCRAGAFRKKSFGECNSIYKHFCAISKCKILKRFNGVACCDPPKKPSVSPTPTPSPTPSPSPAPKCPCVCRYGFSGKRKAQRECRKLYKFCKFDTCKTKHRSGFSCCKKM